MFLRRSALIKYLIAGSLGAVLYCEWFIYLAQPLYWNEIKCLDGDKSCTKVLMIADPQIQGDTAVAPPLSYLYNWDSDRFLKNTFEVVVRVFKPDVLVFLGDLMDEGSIATIVQFHGYVKRLSDIFNINYPVMQIWLPGDNDIGGENEPVSMIKLKEFDKIFDQPDTIVGYNNITFYKVNGIAHIMPDLPSDDQSKDTLKIVLSHYPLTMSSVFGQTVNSKIHPDIYFCAHDHQSKYVKQDKELKHKIKSDYNENDKILKIKFNDNDLYEIYVPTCSYRMGTSKIGYGTVVLDNNNQQMRYTVLWSPTRFPYLFLYLIILIVLFMYFLVFCFAKLIFKCSNNISRPPSKTESSVPLLDYRV